MTPCEWPISYSSCSQDDEGNPSCMKDLPADERQLYEDMATGWLWNWTGGTFGECEVSLRPSRSLCRQPSTWEGALLPVEVGGRWFDMSCGRCMVSDCSCSRLTSLKIPGPVTDVLSIYIDGEQVDPAAYRIDNYNLLVRQDGGSWPTCQDLHLESGEPGTWEITYTRGHPVPAGGRVAAGVLACEFAKAACKDSSCRLPERMKNITRQGVTVTLFDDFKDLEQGKTGIFLIDTWVASVMKAPRPSTVRSPDFRPSSSRRTTWRSNTGSGVFNGGTF